MSSILYAHKRCPERTHRRTGHEILWGQTLVCPTRGLDECRGGWGVRWHSPPRKFGNVESRKCHFLRFEDEIVPFLMLFCRLEQIVFT